MIHEFNDKIITYKGGGLYAEIKRILFLDKLPNE